MDTGNLETFRRKNTLESRAGVITSQILADGFVYVRLAQSIMFSSAFNGMPDIPKYAIYGSVFF